MKRQFLPWILVCFCTIALLCSCKTDPLPGPVVGEEDQTESPGVTDDPMQDDPLWDDVDIIIEDDSIPPQEDYVRSRLTNEWVTQDVAETRPIAVMIPNEAEAIPQYNLSKASILYEANVEGNMTRLMGIFEDWKNLDKLGNIRSLRTYYAYWSFEWDAFLVHFGGPVFIDNLIAQPTTENIDGIKSLVPAFYRDYAKNAPHNAYTSGGGLLKAIEQKGYDLEYRGLTEDNHFQFASKKEPNTLKQYGELARSASLIDMSGCYPLTRCYFEFNEEDGLYHRYQDLVGGTDGPHTDASGTELCFKNVLVQTVKYEDLGEGYLVFQCHDTTRSGWFFTNGRGIRVNWEKTGDYNATRFYDQDGNEISVNTGKTMICVIEEGDTFTFR